MKHTYVIIGMHCQSCVAKVAETIRGVDEVSDVVVTLNPPQAAVTMASHVPLERLNEAVAGKGNYRLQVKEEEAEEAEEAAGARTSTAEVDGPPESLYPLFLIVGYILGVVLLIAAAKGDWSIDPIMRHFMAGFFLVFSFFKLLDLRGFVDTYRGYDLFARRSKAYAWAYPFIELALGVAYLVNLYPMATNLITLVVMSIGTAGVLRALLDKRAIRCACLGTALNLPMTKVTLIEDITMAVMAAAMLLQGLL